MKRVTFDFDGTIDIDVVQEYAKSLIERGVEVWICTSRSESGSDWSGWYDNNDVTNIAEKLGIKTIIYTSMTDKWEKLENKNIIWHLDNDDYEIEVMNENSNIEGILIENGWKEKCEKLLF